MAGEERSVKVKIDHVEKIYEGRNGKMIALNGVDFEIKENEFICVVGPSGCGKSTLLNIIAGLLEPTSGAVYVDGKKVEGTGIERGVVFQQYALFPWLTVLQNVMFGLKLKGMPLFKLPTLGTNFLSITLGIPHVTFRVSQICATNSWTEENSSSERLSIKSLSLKISVLI